ncbi:DUF924 family protein [Thioalkalivibrio paradoxus]|uniref:Membrane protein n=1 Tax=Thioalkalivibrio paradoxus ARh 1 TaxID=713585 RepID=W0DG17_9GAMM|nr:DUF924 family protein [Thioalkalivibrio paradoxus]AHE97594.1 membrane protein [Thioalkalivibrio paradoxus ARh 1]
MNRNTAVEHDHRDVLDFWFSEPVRPLWFRSTPAFDEQLRERYRAVWQTAARHDLDGWREAADSALALVIVLDQFPLNMFRGQAESFSTEAMAREVADHAIGQGWDTEFDDIRKAFLYLPFMHSESLADQERSVALYRAAGLTDSLRWAEHHREIIRRFGRFPHRNAALERRDTPEETEWLSSKQAFRG